MGVDLAGWKSCMWCGSHLLLGRVLKEAQKSGVAQAKRSTYTGALYVGPGLDSTGWGGTSGTLTRIDYEEGCRKSSLLERLGLAQKGLVCGGRYCGSC